MPVILIMRGDRYIRRRRAPVDVERNAGRVLREGSLDVAGGIAGAHCPVPSVARRDRHRGIIVSGYRRIYNTAEIYCCRQP